MGLLSRLLGRGGRYRTGQLLGEGMRKKVYEDLDDPTKVIVVMDDHEPTRAFLDFSRTAHQQGAEYAKHLPNPGELQRIGGKRYRYRTERLDPADDEPMWMVDGRDGFEVGGALDGHPQQASVVNAMKAIDDRLQSVGLGPTYTNRTYYDLREPNFMRRADGSVVINDPVAAALLALGGTAAGGGLLSRARGQTTV